MKAAPRELFYRAILVAGSLAFVFIVGETVLRLLYTRDQARGGTLQEQLERSQRSGLAEGGGEHSLGGLVQASSHEGIIYELKPGLRGTFRGRPLSVSSAGLRDREYGKEKPPGIYRIAGLGDSVMFGWGVDEEETFLNLIERWLNGDAGTGRKYEVLNFAVPGYNTAIETAVFEERVLPWDPDLVIIHFVNNDWGIPKFMQRRPDPLSMKRSYFLDLILARLGMVNLERRGRLVGFRLDEVAEDEEKEEIQSRYRSMTGRIGYRRAMNRLGELAREGGVDVLVLVGSTRKGQMREIESRVAENGFSMVSIGPVTDRVLADYGIPSDREVLRRRMQVAPGDPHPNLFGHYIYAVGLWEQLRTMGIAPPVPAPVFPAEEIPGG